MRLIVRALAALLLCIAAVPALADICRPIAFRGAPVHRASLANDEVRLTFVGHATFLVESPRGVTIETDYNDYVRSGRVPTIATMNRAHSTHYSFAPDSGIAHVLRGWNPDGGTAAEHDLVTGDVRVRNVPTNIRGVAGGTRSDGNSIFLFEVAGLCIAHLGHLHHTLAPSHLREIGRVDIALVPVDGTLTLDLDGMMEVIASLDPAIVVPMHVFGPSTLNRFLTRIERERRVAFHPTPEIVLARGRLPPEPQVLVMPGTHPRYAWVGRR
jgi:L-ascorbate metabolism protein UlaG (beta-lactamase superfamily)